MAAERVSFGTAFTALLGALGERLTPAVADRLRAVGVDPGRELLPAYPVEVFVASARVVAEAGWPGLPRDAAMAELGRALMRRYAEGLLGRALLAVMRAIGPERSLARMTRSLRSTNNYTETRLEQLARGHARLWINIVYETGYYQGLLEAGFALTGFPEARVALVAREGETATYEIRWGAAA